VFVLANCNIVMQWRGAATVHAGRGSTIDRRTALLNSTSSAASHRLRRLRARCVDARGNKHRLFESFFFFRRFFSDNVSLSLSNFGSKLCS